MVTGGSVIRAMNYETPIGEDRLLPIVGDPHTGGEVHGRSEDPSLVMNGSPVRFRASASPETRCKTAECEQRFEGSRSGQNLLFGYRRATPELRVAPLTDVSEQAEAVGHRGTGCCCCADRPTREGAARRRSIPGSEASSCDRLGQPVAVRHASPHGDQVPSSEPGWSR